MDSLGQRFYNKVQHTKNYISNNLDTLTCFDNIGGCGDNGIRNEKKGSTKIYMAAIPAATYQVSAVGATALTDTNDGLSGVTKSEISFLMDSLGDRKSTRLNSSHITRSRMPSSA